MAIILAYDGSTGTQDTSFFNKTAGMLAESTTANPRFPGERSLRMYDPSSGTGVEWLVGPVGVLTTPDRVRFSLWVRYSSFANVTQTFLMSWQIGATAGYEFINHDNVGRIRVSTNYGVATVLTTGTFQLNTWHRLSYSSASTGQRWYLDGTLIHSSPTVLAQNWDGLGFGCSGGTSNVMNDDVQITDWICDDVDSLADIGDLGRVTFKKFAGAGTNQFPTQIGGVATPRWANVSTFPSTDTTGWSTVTPGHLETYTVEDAASGATDITGATIAGYAAWVRTKQSANKAGTTSVSIMRDGVARSLSTSPTVAPYTSGVSTTSYPTGTYGVRADAGTVPIHAGGVYVVYAPAAAPPPSVGHGQLVGVPI